MRITRLELDGIGPFEKAVFEIPPPPPGTKGELVLFEGPNGCGKTTIAQAIAVAATDRNLFDIRSEQFGPPNALLHQKVLSNEGHVSIVIEHDGDVRRVGMTKFGFDRNDIPRDSSPLPPVAARLKRFLEAFADQPTDWVALTFAAHVPSAIVYSQGPSRIQESALRGALSFGSEAASRLLGQFLTNIEFDRVQATLYSAEKSNSPEKQNLDSIASNRKETLSRIKYALSEILDREVDIDFPIGHHAPRILFDGEEIPINLLGEGMRNTVSWLADLLIRLERVNWENKAISPFDQEFWLILDEVELSLHPQMQARIFPTLRKLFPSARIYATTHSPFAVASLGEGYVFSMRPDRKTRRVTGEQKPIKLDPGQSLSWVVEEVFDTPSTFIDEQTREGLEAHNRDVLAIRARQEIDWESFLENRRWLMSLNEEVSTIVAMREVPIQRIIDDKLEERAA